MQALSSSRAVAASRPSAGRILVPVVEAPHPRLAPCSAVLDRVTAAPASTSVVTKAEGLNQHIREGHYEQALVEAQVRARGGWRANRLLLGQQLPRLPPRAAAAIT